MQNYRVYVIEGDDRISLADWIEAEDYEQAIEQARKLKPDKGRCELWHNGRLLAKISLAGVERFSA